MGFFHENGPDRKISLTVRLLGPKRQLEVRRCSQWHCGNHQGVLVDSLSCSPGTWEKTNEIQCVFLFSQKNSILVGVYNQQFQGTIFLMVFHLQGMDWFYWRKKCLCMGFGMTIILRQGLYWNPMKWWWNIWGNAWTKTHMDTVWKPYSVDDLQSTSSFPER